MRSSHLQLLLQHSQPSLQHPPVLASENGGKEGGGEGAGERGSRERVRKQGGCREDSTTGFYLPLQLHQSRTVAEALLSLRDKTSTNQKRPVTPGEYRYFI